MDEQPHQPADRHERIEHRETIERRTGPASPPPTERRRSLAWLWVVLLLAVVGFLAWYALSRGEPQQLEMPEIEAPEVEVPDPEPNIEVNVETPAPAAEGQ